MKSHMITGGGGTRVHVVEAGSPGGRPILFIHGISQCWVSWSRQMNSELADDHRLVAMDMRGHGRSDKPPEGYDDQRMWADDVDAVIRSLELDRPVLCGWSYGGLVLLDYIRHHGEERIAGVHLVGAISRLGTEAAMAALDPEFLALTEGMFSDDAETSVRTVESVMRLCFTGAMTPEEWYTVLGLTVSVPPRVRRAMLSRSFDNDDLLPKIRTHVLITHGDGDRIVKPAAAEEHAAAIAHAQLDIMPGVGHAPFWDDAPAFNRRVRAFVGSL